jgi:hypothetical protein
MLVDIVKRGTTSWRGAVVKVIDSTTGTPETGVVYNTAGAAFWYRREGGVKVSISLVSLAAVDSAYASGSGVGGGFIHIADGLCRLDLPDAALASSAGVNFVDYGGAFTDMVVIGGRIKLTDFDYNDAVRAGLTALPNAAAEASGGLYTRGTGAGQIAQDANGNIRANLDTIKTQAVTCGAGVTVLASVGTASTSTAQTGDSYAIVNSGTYGNSALKTLIDAITAYFTTNRAEPARGNPAASTTFLAKIDYLYKAWRNKKTVTASEESLFADDATTVDQKASLSDDGTTLTRGEMGTG